MTSSRHTFRTTLYCSVLIGDGVAHNHNISNCAILYCII